MRIPKRILLALALLAGSPGAQAAGTLPSDVAAREREAKLACLTGDPSTGARILAELFIDTQSPTYLFNQGRCYEQNARYDDAIKMFREYLRKGSGISAADRSDTEKHIADCEALQAKAGPRATVPPIESGAPITGSREHTPAVATVADTGPARDDNAGAGLRTWGIVAAAAGVSAVVAGALLNYQYNHTVEQLQTSYRPTTESENQAKKTWAVVGYGVGAPLLVGGAVLYYLGWKAGQTTTTILPTVVAGNTGLAVAGTF